MAANHTAPPGTIGPGPMVPGGVWCLRRAARGVRSTRHHREWGLVLTPSEGTGRPRAVTLSRADWRPRGGDKLTECTGPATADPPFRYVSAVSAGDRCRVAPGDERGTRHGGGEGLAQRVLHAVEHQEDVRARVRRDVVAGAVHGVRVEPQRRACLPGELVDPVFRGQLGDVVLRRDADALVLQRALVVVLGCLADALHERP